MSDQGIPIPASVVTAVGRLFVENVLMSDELARQRSGPTIVDEVDENGTLHINRDVKDETITHDGDVEISP